MVSRFPMRWILAISILAAAIPGCATATGTPSAEVAPTPTAEATSVPQVENPATKLWVEVREPGDGYGLAIPCWWPVTLAPAEGIIRSATLASYDEAFFLQHSQRGVWAGDQPPEGAVKIDITHYGGINPNASTAEAVRQALTSDIQGVATMIEAQFGRHPALIAEVHNLVHPADPLHRVVAYRLTGDTLLFVSVYPDAALDSPDVQAMLQSLALSPEETVVLPQHAPAAPLIDLPPTCPTPAS